MNISDLNYLESVEAKVVGGYGSRCGTTTVNKDLNSDISVDLNLDTNIDFNKDFDANINISGYTSVTGNSTTFTFDAEAIGGDSLVEVDVAVLTTDGLSSAAGSIISAVG